MIRKLKRPIIALIQKKPWLHSIKLKGEFLFQLRRTLSRQLKFLNSRPPQLSATPSSPRVLIPLIETNHYQYYQVLGLAKALQLRGAQVKVLLCGSRLDGCELKSIKNENDPDPCLVCRFNLRNVVPLFGLDVVRLDQFVNPEMMRCMEIKAEEVIKDYPGQFHYEGIDLIPTVNDSVVRYFYGAVPAQDQPKLSRIRKQHLISSMIGIEAAKALESEFSPTVIFNNMVTYSLAEPYYKYFANKPGVTLSSITLTPVNYRTVIINILDHFKSTERFLKYRRYRQGALLDKSERDTLAQLMRKRTSGDVPMFKDAQFFEMKNNLEKTLKIDKKKRNLFLFSNVYWDLATAEKGQIYGGVIEWVLGTIALIKDREEVHLYIKTHPFEKFDSAPSLKGVVDFILERYGSIPKNVTLILPEMKIKPYDLFPFIDLGIVYSGTLGLEMLVSEVPVVILGKAPYSNLGFALDPRTEAEYTDILLGKVTLAPAPPKAEIDLFAYYYFIKNFVPLNITEKVYGDDFKGYTFSSLDELMPGKNPELDHVCQCILDPEHTVIESWQPKPE